MSSTVDNEEVILDLSNGTYYGLNEVGAEVWAMISSPRPIPEICSALEEKYDVERDVLEEDVLDLLADMHEHDLIRVVSE